MRFEEAIEEAKKRNLIGFDFFKKHISETKTEEKQKIEYVEYMKKSIESYEYHNKGKTALR